MFIEAKDDVSGDDNWSYKTYKALIKLSPATNQHPAFYRLVDFPVAQPTGNQIQVDWFITLNTLLCHKVGQ